MTQTAIQQPAPAAVSDISLPNVNRHGSVNAGHENDEENGSASIASTTTSSASEHKYGDFYNLAHEIVFMIVVTMAQLITQANLGNTVLPIATVAKGLGIPESEESSQVWFIASYSCTVGAFVLITGRLGDLYGRKNLFLLGWSWLALFNLAAGFCSHPIPFDIMRALSGIGPSMLMPNAAALLGGAWPDVKYKRHQRMKATAFAVFGAVAPAGYVIGSAWGSAIVQLTGQWRWVYWSMTIVAIALGTASWFVVPNTKSLNGKHPGRFDFIGSALGVAGLVLVFVSLNGGPSFGWTAPETPILLIIGVFSLAAFCYAETKVPEPLLPMEIFRSPTFVAVAVSLCCGWMSFGMFQFYTPQFLVRLRHNSILETSLQLIPCALIGIVAAVLAIVLTSRIPPAIIFFSSMTSFFIGQLLLAITPIDQTYWRMTFPTTLVICFGPDLSFACASLIASDKLKPEHQGVAGSFVNTVVNYSVALGLAIAGNVESAVKGQGNGEEDLLRGYRAAWWLGAALAALGMVMTAVFAKGMGGRHKVD